MSDVELNKLISARKDLVPNIHQDITLAQTIESWWGIDDGELMVTTYGSEAVQQAHDVMMTKSEEEIATIRNLGGYFHRVVKHKYATKHKGEPLGRSMPRMKREQTTAKEEHTAEEQREARKRVAQEIPGTLEHRLKYGTDQK